MSGGQTAAGDPDKTSYHRRSCFELAILIASTMVPSPFAARTTFAVPNDPMQLMFRRRGLRERAYTLTVS